jgi:hypothetical protein
MARAVTASGIRILAAALNQLTFGAELKPLVSVVIVNYNGLRFMDECLASLKNAFEKYKYEVIVVDNNSSDGSQQYLANRGDIVFIQSKDNLGFTGGNNLGVASATAELILLLNNDTKIESSLDPLIDRLKDHSVGVVGCQLRYGDGKIQFSVGYEHTPIRIIFSWLGLEKNHKISNIFRRLETDPSYFLNSKDNVAWVSGACLATKKAIWDELSGLDDNFFMYCEDVDYCKRVRNSGLFVSFEANSIVTHYEGGGKEWIGIMALLRTMRSYHYYVAKHYGIKAARATLLALSIIFALRALMFTWLMVFSLRTNQRALRLLKANGFAKASREAMQIALTGRRPWLP